MRKRIEWEWEVLNDHPASATKRAKVIGGWIVVHQTFYDLGTNKALLSESMSFVTDQHHEWQIAAPFNPSDPGKLHPKVKAEDFDVPSSKL